MSVLMQNGNYPFIDCTFRNRLSLPLFSPLSPKSLTIGKPEISCETVVMLSWSKMLVQIQNKFKGRLTVFYSLKINISMLKYK